MVDQFNPNQLRHDLLRRVAGTQSPQDATEPGLVSKCAEELRCWFCKTPAVQLVRRWCRHSCACRRSKASTVEAPIADNSYRGSDKDNDINPVGAPDSCPIPSEVSQAPAQEESGFPARAICKHVGNAISQLRRDLKVMLFLDFPRGSPYQDATVEALFQWHYTCRWWLCLEWWTVALLAMLFWDIAMNPPYKVTLIILFYAAFATALLLRRLMILASPTPSRWRRVWHNVLLCGFFFGRCIVCQPVLLNFVAGNHSSARQLQAETFSSVIGLGMTNLSLVFMPQIQTVDMLLFCVINGVVFILWIIFILQMPLTDALHTAYVGSIVVTAVCVRQQRDQEDLERRSFDHELLHSRGTLVRSADRISAQASDLEFAVSMQILSKARFHEHLNF